MLEMPLTVVYGPMFAGKTTSLLGYVKPNSLLLKPAMDTRYSENNVVTHDGKAAPALSISAWPRKEVTKFQTILVDEIQFCVRPHYAGNIVWDIQDALEHGHDVVVAGLDKDWRAVPFAVTEQLLSMADHRVQMFARCTVCQGNAKYTWRKDGSGGAIQLGHQDIYEARCCRHHPLVASDMELQESA